MVLGTTRALDGVGLSVEPGEFVALVGPSGAGKTSLLRVLNGTLLPDAGRLQVDGVDPREISMGQLQELRSHLGFVHQDHALVPNLRVSQNVIAGRLGQRGFLSALRSMTWPAQGELEQVHGLLERVGIGDKLFERTDRLSGGERQRAAVARALFQTPRALLADEPVASVDPARARDIIRLLVEVAGERSLTLVVSLHDVRLAREFFPRCVGLREGRVVFDRRTEDLGDAEFDDLYRLESV